MRMLIFFLSTFHLIIKNFIWNAKNFIYFLYRNYVQMYLNKLNVNRIYRTLFKKQLKRSTNNEALLEKSSERGKNTIILMRLWFLHGKSILSVNFMSWKKRCVWDFSLRLGNSTESLLSNNLMGAFVSTPTPGHISGRGGDESNVEGCYLLFSNTILITRLSFWWRHRYIHTLNIRK